VANMILSQSFLEAALVDEITSVSDTMTVCLSSSSVPFSDSTTITAAIAGESSYPGYARQPWPATPIGLVGNDYAVAQGTMVFSPPSSGGTVPIYGYFVLYIDPGSATALLGGNNFADSIGLSPSTPGLALVLNLKDYDGANP
jgi:hypothetical protein